MILLDKQAINTTGTQAIHRFSQQNDGRRNALIAEGTFDGATVSIEIRRPGREWVPIADSEFTEANAVLLECGVFDVRGVLTGAGGSTDVTLELVE